GVLAVALGCWSKSRGFLYAAGILASLARSIWWYFRAPGDVALPDFVSANVTIWLLPALVSLAVEKWIIRPAEEAPGKVTGFRPSCGGLGFHRVAAVAALVCLAVLAFAGLSEDVNGAPQATDASGRWMALASTGAMVVACLWDPGSVAPLLALHVF